jgi:ATP-dependent RNA helicase DHX36
VADLGTDSHRDHGLHSLLASQPPRAPQHSRIQAIEKPRAHGRPKDHTGRRLPTPHNTEKQPKHRLPRNSKLLEDSQPAVPPHTEDYIRRHFALPTRAQFPAAPEALFQLLDGELSNFDSKDLKNILKKEHVVFTSKIYDISPHRHGRSHLYCHKMRVSAHNGWAAHVYGEGTTRALAFRSCCLHAIARLHEAGLLNEFFGRPSVALLMQDTPGRSGNDDKVTMFDYAARYMLVPRITTTPISDDILRLARAQRHCRPRFECAITLAEHDLKAVRWLH